jgi:type IV pilus assembly protein PilV
MKRMNHRPHRQAGMTLIEVLVAILIFSFGLLGFVGLQARAIKYSTSAEDSNRASLLANELATEMQLAGTVVLPPTKIAEWQARAASDPMSASYLPGAAANVSLDATNTTATIKITWQPPSAASGVNSMDTYETQVVIP